MGELLDPEGNETRAIWGLVDFSGRDVVEVGCGDGRLTWRYAAAAATVRAIEPVEEAIGRARAAMPETLRGHVTFETGDVSTTVLGQGAYDVALLSRSL
ncbi:MAG: class I SAM-dependent methyltransferase [Chloroflexota bacterium]|nr:MAG: class I SAM-dependent methyltransferase [Chloroflexota bacterium]